MEGKYIRIIGQVEDFGGVRSILASEVQPASGNDLTNHPLDVVKSYDRHLQKQERMNGASGTTPQRRAVGGGANMQDDSAVRAAVIECIRASGNTDTGIHVDQIVHQLALQARFPSSSYVRDTIVLLSNEGRIYSTIDENYYQYAE